MNLSEIYTADKLRAAVLQTLRICQTEWLHMTGLSFVGNMSQSITLKVKVKNNDFYRTINTNDNLPPKDYVELSVSDLASDEAMGEFWTLVEAMHAETHDEEIERRLKALESR